MRIFEGNGLLELIDRLRGSFHSRTDKAALYSTDAVIGTGADVTLIDRDGTMTMHGEATHWLDEKGQLSSAKVVSPSSKIIQDDAEAAYYYKDNCTTADYLWVSIQFNHDRENGYYVSPHLHWWQPSATIPNWLLQYRWQIIGQAKTTAWTSVAISSHGVTYVSGTLVQVSDFPDLTPPAGDGVSAELQCRIIRDTNNGSGLFSGADGLAGNVYIYDFDAHKRCDSHGSPTEYGKPNYLSDEDGILLMDEDGAFLTDEG